LTDDSNLKELA